ncbi:MAG: NAD-dependent succinate-semialdehyde dehydrogenase [Sphingomonadales bacterium]|nr:NAD-dependent succinate-semialdehyde dehydrogenase [Sphingomonadales bacterium]
MNERYETTLSLHIDGEWIGVGDRQTHDVVDPATGDVLGALPMATADDLDRALDASARGYKIWRAKTADQRGAVLTAAAQLLRERADKIATIATLERGSPLPRPRANSPTPPR